MSIDSGVLEMPGIQVNPDSGKKMDVSTNQSAKDKSSTSVWQRAKTVAKKLWMLDKDEGSHSAIGKLAYRPWVEAYREVYGRDPGDPLVPRSREVRYRPALEKGGSDSFNKHPYRDLDYFMGVARPMHTLERTPAEVREGLIKEFVQRYPAKAAEFVKFPYGFLGKEEMTHFLNDFGVNDVEFATGEKEASLPKTEAPSQQEARYLNGQIADIDAIRNMPDDSIRDFIKDHEALTVDAVNRVGFQRIQKITDEVGGQPTLSTNR